MFVTVSSIRSRLQECYSAREAANLSRIVCCEMLGQRDIDYYRGKDIALSRDEETRLADILSRLCNFEPMQYVQGTTRFLGRTFQVRKGVLIPRPETEELVERIIDHYKSPATNDKSRLRVLDIGTGSGCIAISLAKELHGAEVTAWDISEEALGLAAENSRRLQASVRFVKQDVTDFEPRAADRYEVVVSNPPYVTESERAEMEQNVLAWEPSAAIFVPDADPLRFYRRIGEIGREMLTAGGRLFFEINRLFGEAIAELLQEQGYTDVVIEKDISGNNRFVKAKR